MRFALVGSCVFALSTIGSLGPSPALADGKLSRAREEAHGSSSGESSSSSSSSSSQRHHGHRRGHHDTCENQSFFDAVFCAILACDCGIPDYESDTVVVESQEDEPQPTYASYPYATSKSPYLLEPELQVASTSAELDAHLLAEHSPGRPWAGQLSLDAGFMSGIGQSTLNARVLMPAPFELSARNTLLWEPAARDYSLFGSAVLGIRFLQAPSVLMRLFGGFSYFGQLGDVAVGAELGIGMDVFLGRPWVLSANAATAFVGQAFAPQARVQLGYLFGRSEVFVGYQYMQIGSVGLSTPLLGTRIWL
jgi:hypothetical protein